MKTLHLILRNSFPFVACAFFGAWVGSSRPESIETISYIVLIYGAALLCSFLILVLIEVAAHRANGATRCADCQRPMEGDGDCQLEDGRVVCTPCAVADLRRIVGLSKTLKDATREKKS